MTEPDQLPTPSPVVNEEAPTPVACCAPAMAGGAALPGRRLAQVTMTSLVLGIGVAVAVFLPQAREALVPLCLSLVPLFAVAAVAAILFAATGEDDVPALPLLAGWLVILGGTACDIYATLSHSPDLDREANPIIRALLDNGVSLKQVYVVAALLQLLYIVLAMALWLGFLKHRRTLATTMPPAGSLLTYFKAGTGGRELTYRQWLCPFTYSEFPWACHLAWWTGVVFIGVSVYRFYVALEWYQVAPLRPPGVRFVVPSVLFLATCWWYAAWLRGARARLDREAIAITIDGRAGLESRQADN